MSDRRHFIVIGSMKSGTTSLYQRLLAHPEIAMSRMKETDYFVESANWPLGEGWYKKQFGQGGRITGEVSPNYSKHDIFP
ncbi:MAG: sulfotransferase, partial [Pseudomonadota bacterium]